LLSLSTVPKTIVIHESKGHAMQPTHTDPQTHMIILVTKEQNKFHESKYYILDAVGPTYLLTGYLHELCLVHHNERQDYLFSSIFINCTY
jgi:hypothetical protein